VCCSVLQCYPSQTAHQNALHYTTQYPQPGLLSLHRKQHATTLQTTRCKTHCNTLPDTATHCATLHCTASLNITQYTRSTHYTGLLSLHYKHHAAKHTARHCTTPHHTAPHCISTHYTIHTQYTLHHTKTHPQPCILSTYHFPNTLHHTAPRCISTHYIIQT